MSTENYDPFAQAKEIQDEQEKAAKRAKNGGNYISRYIQAEYFPLEVDNLKAFRIVGIPAEARKTQFDPKIVLQSKIKKDDGKNLGTIIFPWVIKDGKYKPDSNYIFTKLMDKVNESNWVDYIDSDIGIEDHNGDMVIKGVDGKIINDRTKYTGRYIPLHKDTDIFKMFRDNFIMSKNGKKITNNTYPSTRIIMNIIDRMDTWCKDNNMLKVLTNSTKVYTFTDENGNEQKRVYADTGISKKLYDKILNHIRRFRDNWYIDLVICRVFITGNWDWEILDATDVKKLPEHIRNVVSENDLTKEELNYVGNDLDAIYKPTSAFILKKHFEERFRQADLELGTNFLQELDNLIDVEKEEWKKNNKTEAPPENVQTESRAQRGVAELPGEKVITNEPDPLPNPVPQVAISDVVEPSSVRLSDDAKEILDDAREGIVEGIAKEAKDTNSVNFSVLPFWGKLNDMDRNDIIDNASSMENDIITFKDSTKVLPCDSCQKPLPNTVSNCPYCGKSFSMQAPSS